MSQDNPPTHQNLWPDELKILAIDDHQDILNLMRLSLEPAGFRLIRTNNPKEGLSLAMSEEPDLLLLDLMMPELHFFEFRVTSQAAQQFETIQFGHHQIE